MIYSIIVGDVTLNLNEDTVIALTLVTADVGSIQNRYANYTNQFRIPFSATNDSLLGFCRLLSSRSTVPYAKFSGVTLLMAGVEVLNNATLYVVNCEEAHYVIQIVSDLGGLMTAMGDGLINELDINDNQVWTSAILDTNRNSTSGLMCPLINYGKLNVAPIDVVAPFYLPTYSLQDVVNAAIIKAGYTNGSISSMDTTLGTFTHLTRLGIAFSRETYEYAETFAQRRRMSANADGTQSQVFAAGAPANVGIKFPVVNESGALGWYDSATGVWNVPTTGYDFVADAICVLDVTYTHTSGTAQLRFNVNGALAPNLFTMTGSGNYVVYFAISAAAFGHGTANIYARMDHSGAGTIVINSASYMKIDIRKKPTNTYLLSALLPDIKAKDLFKEYLMRAGLIAKEKKKVISYKSIEAIIQDRANALDWTLKRNPNKRDKITYLNSKYARNNYYVNQEQDEIPSGYGDGNLTIANPLLSEKTTLYESLASSVLSYDQTIAAHDPINLCSIPVYDAGSADEFVFVAPPQGIKIISLRAAITADPPVKYNGTVRTSYQVATFNNPQFSYKADWQSTIDRTMPSLKAALQSMKVIVREYNLTTADIGAFDFFLPIFDTDAYFLVNKISEFIPGRMTQVELIKLP